jgi:hypothetical protein
MRPEDDPRQTNFGDAIDGTRKRREEVIRQARPESRPTAAATGPVSPDDRRRALSLWKSGWLTWHESGMTGDEYDVLLTSLVGASTLDALVERYWSQHRAVRPASYVDAAHYNAGVSIERRNAGIA